MATTTFAAGTVIASTWLNDVDAIVYDAVVSVPWTTVTWSGTNVTHSGNHTFSNAINAPQIVFNAGATAATSALVPPTNATLYSILGKNGVAGPGIQARWDTATVNRYIAFGIYNNAGSWFSTLLLDDSQNALVVSNGGLGYGTGSGGTVTQATNKSTAVTLNRTNGQVVMHNAALAAGALVSFTVNNSTVASTDVVIVNLVGGTYSAVQNYRVWVENMASGLFAVTLENRSAGSLSEAVGINFAVIKAVTS